MLTIWWCPCIESSLVLLEEGVTSVFSWQNSISLCPASFHIPRPSCAVTPGVSWLPTFAFQSPIMWRGQCTPLQYSCLENPMDGGAWWAAVDGVARSQTRLSDFTFTFHFYALEKEMATHSSVLAWRIPGMVEPGGLPSMGSHRVEHDWSDLAAAAAPIMKRTSFFGC